MKSYSTGLQHLLLREPFSNLKLKKVVPICIPLNCTELHGDAYPGQQKQEFNRTLKTTLKRLKTDVRDLLNVGLGNVQESCNEACEKNE